MEAPYLQKAYQQSKGRGGLLIGVGVTGDEISGLKEFRTRHKVSYPIALDADNRVFGRFNLAFPATVLIDKTGVIRFIEEGFDQTKFAATQARFAALLAAGTQATTVKRAAAVKRVALPKRTAPIKSKAPGQRH